MLLFPELSAETRGGSDSEKQHTALRRSQGSAWRKDPPRAPPNGFAVSLPRLKPNEWATQFQTLLGKHLRTFSSAQLLICFHTSDRNLKARSFSVYCGKFQKAWLETASLLPLTAFQRQTDSESGADLSSPTPARHLRWNGRRPRAPSVLRQRAKQITWNCAPTHGKRSASPRGALRWAPEEGSPAEERLRCSAPSAAAAPGSARRPQPPPRLTCQPPRRTTGPGALHAGLPPPLRHGAAGPARHLPGLLPEPLLRRAASWVAWPSSCLPLVAAAEPAGLRLGAAGPAGDVTE